MKYKIKWLAKAEEDLISIENYIAEENILAAIEVSERILASVARLADHPKIGVSGRVKGTRELVALKTPFIVIYRLEGDSVQIIRVLHGARIIPDKDRSIDTLSEMIKSIEI